MSSPRASTLTLRRCWPEAAAETRVRVLTAWIALLQRHQAFFGELSQALPYVIGWLIREVVRCLRQHGQPRCGGLACAQLEEQGVWLR
jgi:hypothetical protein